MRLTLKIGLVIGSAAAVAAVALAVLGYFLVQQSASVPVSDKHFQAARQLMDAVDLTLVERRNDMVAISQDSAVAQLVRDPGNGSLRSAATARLAQVATVTGPWDELYVLDRTSSILAALEESTVGHKFESDVLEPFVRAGQGGEVVASDVILDPESGRPNMVIVAPVRLEQNPGRPVVATVVGYLSWNSILNILKNDSSEKTSATLYNRTGVVIGNKDQPEQILKQNQSEDPVVKLALEGQEKTEIFTVEGRSVVVSIVKEKGRDAYKGNDWFLVLETPADAAFAAARGGGFTLVVSLVAVMALGAVAAIFMVARVVKPIGALTASANRLAIGDLSHRVKVVTKDEIGQLGSAFNNMAGHLQELYKHLEAKVQEKTVKLALRTQQAEANAAKDEAVLSSIGEGLIAANPDGRVVRINTQALEIFGLKLEEILGRKILDVVTFAGEKGEKLEQGQLPTVEAMSSNKRTEGMYQIQQPKGIKVVVAVIASPIILQGGPAGIIMIIRDVTKEREVDRMKTEFISLASHQLRTPLSSIKWFSEMLLAGDAGKLAAEQTEFVKNVYESTQRMIELVNSLLNISRIESGRIIVDPKPTDLNGLITGIVSDLKAKISAKGQNLVVSVHKDLPKVNLDPQLIGQVYLNFLTNAIKYTPKGGEISVIVSRKGDELVSQVTDNGYGIPLAQQDRIFQKFFRAENIVKIETDGTGLGMYLVKAIIESSGGKVWFKSEENKGTTFWFSLPMSGMKAKEGEVSLDIVKN